MSACVTVCDAEHDTEAPGANDATGETGEQLPMMAAASETETFDNVTLPEFVTTMSYAMTSPTLA